MTYFLFFLFFFTNLSWGQRIEVSWNDSFTKEVRITCSPENLLCEKICSAASACYLEEGLCRNCVGTGLQMHHLFSELGRSIRRKDPAAIHDVAALLKTGGFVTFMARDTFNIIDAHNSLEVYRKFESLCPEGSLEQILFLRADPVTRMVLKPEFVYCEFEEKELFFKIEDKILIERGLKIHPRPPF